MPPERLSDVVEEEDEPVPQLISDEFFRAAQMRTQTVIRDLREKEQYRVADEFIRLSTIAENLQLNLKDEQGKIQELTEHHVDATGRIQEAMKISQRDHDTINKLREEVVDAWKIADASKLREVELTERFDRLRNQFESTQKELKNLSYKTEDTAGLQGKHKVTVLAECERLSAKVTDLNKRLLVQLAFNDEIQNKLDESLEKNQEIFKEWDEATNESLSNRKRLESLTKRLASLEEKLQMTTDSMLHYQNQSEKRYEMLKERDKQITGLVEDLEKSRDDNASLKAAKAKLEANLKLCANQRTDMRHELDQTLNFMRMKEDENRKLVIDNERQIKKIDGFIRKISTIETVISKNEQDMQNLHSEIVTAEKERDSIRRTNDAMKRDNQNLSQKIENLMREIEKRDGECNGIVLVVQILYVLVYLLKFQFQKQSPASKAKKRVWKRTKS